MPKEWTMESVNGMQWTVRAARDWLSHRPLAFQQAVFAVAHRLLSANTPPHARVLIGGSESPRDFTLLLLGTLYAGLEPVLMSADASTRARLRDAYDMALLSEQESTDGLGDTLLVAVTLPAEEKMLDGAPTPTAEELIHFWAAHSLSDTTPLWLYTSGSSGTPKAISKTLAQMDAEARSVVAHFAESLATDLKATEALRSATVYSTVDPHHQYGLTFAVWFPMALGLQLSTDRIRYEEMLTSVSPWILITTPTFMRTLRLPFKERGVVDPLWAMSAGGKLSDEDYACWRTVSSSPIEEIYGSTECGIMAHRRHTGDDMVGPWTLAQGVSLTILEDTPWLTSAHASDAIRDANGRIRLDDKLQCLSERTFILLGRADRVAKVGEKRLSLTDIENVIARELGLTVKALVVQRPARDVIGVVVNRALSPDYDATQHREYRNRLVHHLEPLALPRYWRSVDTWPVNAQGKVEMPRLEELFHA